MDAFQNLPSPCAITTLEGKILQVNEALCALLGKTAEDLQDAHLDTITTLASRIFMQTHTWPMLRKDNHIKELFIKLKCAEQGDTPVMADCAVRHNDSTPQCYWVFYIAHERSKFEKELIAARKEVETINVALAQSQHALKLANEELERFIYNVSHDLRAPLISINGFSNQLKLELSAYLNDRQKQRFERISANISKMQRLMDDLLKLSRITRQEIEFEIIDLSTLVDEQLELIAKSLSDIDAKVTVDMPYSQVSSNRTLLEQSIGNLLTNAVAYRDPSRVLEIDITSSQSDDCLSIHVQDNGIGIAEQDQQRIFNMFEHLLPTQGTGVGLAIVKTAMEKVNGTISVKSTPNEGSTFTLHLPCDNAAN